MQTEIVGNVELEIAEERLTRYLEMADGRKIKVITQIVKSEQQYRDRDWLAEQYTVKNMSMQEIADICDVSAMTINLWLNKYDIPTRSRGRR